MVRTLLLFILRGFFIVIIAYLMVYWGLFIFWVDVLHGPYISGESRLKVVWKGMNESNMLVRLSLVGAKLLAVYNKDSKALYLLEKDTENYYKERAVFRAKPIINKLYIFECKTTRGWFWVNEKGIVEHIILEDISLI